MVTMEEEIAPEDLTGQSFASEKAAVQYYSSYAAERGFSARLDEIRRLQDGTVRSRDIVCHRQGQPAEKRQVTLEKILGEKRNRTVSRCGCEAMIRVVRETTAESEEWIVRRHTREHNHSLLSKEEASLLPAFRFICPEDGDRIKLLKRAGLKISDILNVLRLEKGEVLSFNSRDVRNLLSKEFVGSGDQGSTRDVGDLLKILKEKSERECKFFYDFTVDEDERLENIVWIPGNAKQMAGVFADVVVFDTTYRLNRYSMPFGCFAAVNNHGQTVILGGTLMRNETSESFRWIFRTWSRGIGRMPDCILTDQDRAMKDAISTELPNTKHGFCFWHITQKFPSWFNSKLGEEFQVFMKEFFVMLEVETATEFEALWFTIIERHSLQDDRHIKELFELRKYWCPVYLRSYFFAGMTSTQRSESLNSLMDFFMTAQLCRSIAQRGAVVPGLRTQLEADLDSMYEHTFGSTSEDHEKSFPPIRGKRLLLSPSSLPAECDNLSTVAGDGVLIDKTNIEELQSARVKNPPVCVTKGRPRSCRFKSAIENVAPKGRVCRACGKVANHDKCNCPSLHSENQ